MKGKRNTARFRTEINGYLYSRGGICVVIHCVGDITQYIEA